MAMDQNLCEVRDVRDPECSNIVNENILLISKVCLLILIQKRADIVFPNREILRGFEPLVIDERFLLFPQRKKFRVIPRLHWVGRNAFKQIIVGIHRSLHLRFEQDGAIQPRRYWASRIGFATNRRYQKPPEGKLQFSAGVEPSSAVVSLADFHLSPLSIGLH
jgi:hypothetical protein